MDDAIAFAPDSALVPDIKEFRKRIEGSMKKTAEKASEPAAKK